ncbi:MAG TPA: hypothetical protein QGF58_29420 [Myxococcota bacterium]|nr:hypothetical protein [Myxococcota bacterium]
MTVVADDDVGGAITVQIPRPRDATEALEGGVAGVVLQRDVRVAVVAVLACRVAVCVRIADGAIAVVVVGIRAVVLGRARIEGPVLVVAVPGCAHVALWDEALHDAVGPFSPAVAVLVDVPGGLSADAVVVVIDGPVAVVIDLVADL